MKQRFLAICSIAALLMVIGPVAAWAGPATLTLNDGGSITLGNAYVGPYNLTLTATNNTTTPLQLICNTASNDVSTGEFWQFTTENYSNLPSSLTGALFYAGTSATEQEYEEVAYLANEILSGSYTDTQVGELQYALWDIFDPGFSNSLLPAVQTQVNAYLSAAQTNYASGNYSDLTIFTPIAGTQQPPGNGTPQEFIGKAAEPSSILLLSIVLLGFLAAGGGYLRRREV